MKRVWLLLVGTLVLSASCATFQQNLDARTFLTRCQYEFAGIQVTGVTFRSGVLIDAVDFAVSVKVTNPTDRDVALDHADLSFFLDKNPVLDASHARFVRIAPSASAVEPVGVRLPFAGIVQTLGHRPETLGVKAKLWVTLLVGKATWETPIVIPVEVEVPVPYAQIDAFVAQKQKELEAEAATRAQAAAQAAAEAAQKALPSPTLKF